MRIPTLVSTFALGIALTPAPSHAQSLYNAVGMGLPVESIDGRARALGNLGIGLEGSALLPSDPGAAGLLFAPTAVIVGQPSWVEYDQGTAGAGSFQGNRFPLVGIGYPAFSGMFTLTLSSFLDQDYESRRTVRLELQGVESDVTDMFEQDGSIGSVNVGYSQALGPNTAVGINLGRYAGSVLRRLERDFGAITQPRTLESYETSGRWTYSGTSVTGGAAVDIATIVRVAGSLTWSSALQATAADETEGDDRSFHLPLQFRVGTSAVLAPGLMITASMVRADWSSTENDFNTPTTVGSTSGLGIGLELSRARLLGMAAPLRFGYRRSELPFSYGSEAATERIFAAGIGLSFSETQGVVLGVVDLAIERGRRFDAVLTETFWRATVSLRVSGY